MTLTTLFALFLLWIVAGLFVTVLMINGIRRLEDDQQTRDLRPRTPLDWDDFDARR